jgi:1,4-alpha-glucan branching enzyme
MARKNGPSKTKTSRKQVRFSIIDLEAESVTVVGDFNQWDPKSHLLKRKGDGVWEKTIPLSPGTYEYKFLIDGKWRLDPSNQDECQNAFGTRNNILIVPTT